MMGDPPPLVSAVIATHNRRHYVVDAVESALNQEYPTLEVLVVDDGSTDGTAQMLRERFGDRIRVIEQENGGVGTARNRGAAEARGDFVAFLDDDDVWLADKTRLQVDCFLEHGEHTVLVGGGATLTDDGLEPQGPPTLGDEVVSYEQLCVWTALPGSGSNCMVRKSAFDRAGGFDPSLVRAQDRELWIRLARIGTVRTVRVETARIRLHETPRKGVDFKRILEARRKVNARIPERHLRRKADAMMFNSLAHRSRARGHRMRGWWYLFRSFATHPGSLDRRVLRARRVVEWLVPRPVLGILGAIKRRIG